MSIESLVVLILSGGAFGSVLSWLTTRHRPKVDKAEVVITGQGSLIDDIRAERDRLDARINAVEERAASAEARAADAEGIAAYAVAQNSAWERQYHDLLEDVRAGRVPPFRGVITIHPALADRLTVDDLPDDKPVNPPEESP